MKVYLAVNKDGQELVSSSSRLARIGDEWLWPAYDGSNTVYLPKGSIQKLIGVSLKWEDDPVEYESGEIMEGTK